MGEDLSGLAPHDASDNGRRAQAHALTDGDQASAASDQAGAHSDQAGADSDQASADTDQLAADLDQAASDRDQAVGTDPGEHERSRGVRRSTAATRDRTARARLTSADERDRAAFERDAAARARDAEAEVRDRALRHDDADAGQDHPDASTLASATEQRELAAQEREHAAEHAARAAADRRQAAQDREQASGDRRQAQVDRELLSRKLAATETDPLTGARTRAAGLTDLDHELERCRRAGTTLVVAYIDIVGLKALNDTKGHDAGDRLLAGVVAQIKRHLRPYDIVVRLGGDEFLCAMSTMTEPDARRRLAQVAAALAGVPHPCAIRAGFAQLSADDTATRLIARADHALLDLEAARIDVTDGAGPDGAAARLPARG